MDRPWRTICADLDRDTGRRFPPVAGRGRGYRLDVTPGEMKLPEAIEFMRHEARLDARTGPVAS